MTYRTIAIARFAMGDAAGKIFLYLNQLRMHFGNGRYEPAKGLVLTSQPERTHRVEIKVASSLSVYELAPITDFLLAVENLGASVEYY